MEKIREILSFNLKRIRREQGYNQKEVAAACGFEIPSYSRWENGKSWPNPETIECLSKFYKVSPCEFYRNPKGFRPTLTEALKIVEEELGIRLENKRNSSTIKKNGNGKKNGNSNNNNSK